MPTERAKKSAGKNDGDCLGEDRRWQYGTPLASTANYASIGHALTSGRYVGAEELEDDNNQFAESAQPDMATNENLKGLGYGT